METLDDVLARNWWVILLRGIAGILFGFSALLVPGLTFAALVLVFGAYAFADGVLALVSSFQRGAAVRLRWVHAVEGLVGIIAGVVTVLWPGLTAIALLYLVAGWSLVSGILGLVAAVRLRKVIRGEWLLALSSISSIGLGLLLALLPGPGALALTLWIGAYALVSGVVLLALSLRLRSYLHDSHTRNVSDGTQVHEPLSDTSGV